MNNIFLNGLLPSINVPNWNVPKARAMKRGQSANLSTKQNILWDGTFAKTNSGKVYQSVTTQLQKTSDFTSLVATISIQWVPLILLKWPCFGSTEWWDQNFDRNRDFFSKTKFSETETFFLRPNFLKPKPDTGLNRNLSDILQTLEQQTNK